MKTDGHGQKPEIPKRKAERNPKTEFETYLPDTGALVGVLTGAEEPLG